MPSHGRWHTLVHRYGTNLVLRECSRLVTAHASGVAHGLAGSQHAHQVLVEKHTLHRVGERQRDSEGQTFWHGNHQQGDAENEDLDQVRQSILKYRLRAGQNTPRTARLLQTRLPRTPRCLDPPRQRIR